MNNREVSNPSPYRDIILGSKEFNPRNITFRYRIQTDIEKYLVRARELQEELLSRPDSGLMIDVSHVFLEAGDMKTALKYADMAFQHEIAKEESVRDPEILAMIHYVFSVKMRKENNHEKMKNEYLTSSELNKTHWLLVSNQINIGLWFMEHGKYRDALRIFEQLNKKLDDTFKTFPKFKAMAFRPVVKSYYAFALSRGLPCGVIFSENPTLLFEEAALLYEEKFLEKNIDQTERQCSLDWQWHLFHRALILFESANFHSMICDPDSDTNNKIRHALEKAEEILKELLICNKASHVNDATLGDTYFWLGRITGELNQHRSSVRYFEQALKHYQYAFPQDSEEEIKIIETRTHLESEKEKIPNPFRFFLSCCPCTKKEAAEDVVRHAHRF